MKIIDKMHYASLEGLVLELDHVKELFEARICGLSDKIEERNRRFEDRFIASDEKASLAWIASKEAVSKAEAAIEKRFEGVNEFRRTLSDQALTFISRLETIAKFSAYDGKIEDIKSSIADLRESRSKVGGEKEVLKESQLARQWMVGLTIAVFFSFCGLVLSIITLLIRR